MADNFSVKLDLVLKKVKQSNLNEFINPKLKKKQDSIKINLFWINKTCNFLSLFVIVNIKVQWPLMLTGFSLL